MEGPVFVVNNHLIKILLSFQINFSFLWVHSGATFSCNYFCCLFLLVFFPLLIVVFFNCWYCCVLKPSVHIYQLFYNSMRQAALSYSNLISTAWRDWFSVFQFVLDSIVYVSLCLNVTIAIQLWLNQVKVWFSVSKIL